MWTIRRTLTAYVFLSALLYSVLLCNVNLLPVFAVCFYWDVLAVFMVPNRENLNNWEGQPESAIVDKYDFTWTTKAFDVTQNFNYRGPI